MTSDEKQKICENIFLYITTELDDWMDTQIFTRTSMKELGELYYSHVLNEVENADTDLLNAVIRAIKPSDIECTMQEDHLKYGRMLQKNMMKYLSRSIV